MGFFRKIADWLVSISGGDASVFVIILAILSAVSFFVGKYFVDGDEHGCLGIFLQVGLSFFFGFLALMTLAATLAAAL